MRKLTKNTLKLMNSIIEKIESGELAHKQDTWYCGTAHCFIGWMVVINRSRKHKDRKLITKGCAYENFYDMVGNETGITVFVNNEFGLSHEEINIIARTTNSLEKIKTVVAKLNEGQRFYLPFGEVEPVWGTYEDALSSGAVW